MWTASTRLPGASRGPPSVAPTVVTPNLPRMSKRKIIGLVVVGVWVATLGWYAARLYLEPEAEQLAAAARTLPPGVAYYAVYQGDRHTGWAQSQIDTLPSGSGFVVNDRIQVDLSGMGSGLGLEGISEVRTRARLGPALGLEEFSVDTDGLLGGLRARGRVAGDTLLELEVDRGGETTSHTVPLEGSVMLGTTLPLRIAAEGGSAVGDRFQIATLDPVSMEVQRRSVEILERDIRTFPDSMERDPETREWRVVGRDTVLAWRIERELGGTSVEAWVDEDGRYLELATGVGLRLERTSFELAYFGSGIPSEQDAAPDTVSSAPPPTPGGDP